MLGISKFKTAELPFLQVPAFAFSVLPSPTLSGLDNCSCYVLIRHDRSTRELAHADTQTDGKIGR